ncbi:membrane dipeptidase [bacterium]|nr:membrane dipeptidase [bacterium]
MIPVFDLHCDTLTKGGAEGLSGDPNLQWDLPRFKQGGGQLQVHAIFTPPKLRMGDATLFAISHIGEWERYLRENEVGAVRSQADLEGEGSLSLLALEDGAPLGGELSMLDFFFELGVRLITLVWSCDNEVGRGVTGTGPALTPFGKNLLTKMENLGVAVDLSHASEGLFWDVLERATKPPLASHSNARALRDHPRNLTDSQLIALGKKGGLVGLTFVPAFIGCPPSKEVEWEFALEEGASQLANHARHIADLAGVEILALGSDFDGTTNPVVGDASGYQEVLLPALDGVGFSRVEVEGIFHANAHRYLSTVLPT